MPERLKLNQRLGHPVVQPDDALALLAAHQAAVLRKALHGRLDAAQQLARPHDISGLG
jgi:hypothetical protein